MFTIVLLTCLCLLVYFYYKKVYGYWKKRNVPYLKPLPVIGNCFDMITQRRTASEWLKDIYDSTDHPYVGLYVFNKPHLLIKSPKLIKDVLVKDFDVFSNRTVANSTYDTSINFFPFFQKNPEWKLLRSKLTNTFTTGRLKLMLNHLNSIGREFSDFINNSDVKELDARHVSSRFSTETTLRCFFGVKAYSFDSTKSYLYKLTESLMAPDMKNIVSQLSYFMLQEFVNPLKLTFVKEDLRDQFIVVLNEILEQRKNADCLYNDFMDTFIDVLKNEEFCKTIKLENETIVGPPLNFLIGGHDTTASTISFTFYELALQEKIKSKVVDEIFSTLNKYGSLTYEAIDSMKYLKMCICETLRKYPVLAFLDRRCQSTYKFEGYDLEIERGTPIFISLMGLHYDPQYYPEPEKYIPERYENKLNNDGLSYIPFGEGPRICIGKRFGLLATQVAIVHILSRFDVKINAQTPLDMKFDPKTLLLQSKSGLSLTFEHLSKPFIL